MGVGCCPFLIKGFSSSQHVKMPCQGKPALGAQSCPHTHRDLGNIPLGLRSTRGTPLAHFSRLAAHQQIESVCTREVGLSLMTPSCLDSIREEDNHAPCAPCCDRARLQSISGHPTPGLPVPSLGQHPSVVPCHKPSGKTIKRILGKEELIVLTASAMLAKPRALTTATGTPALRPSLRRGASNTTGVPWLLQLRPTRCSFSLKRDCFCSKESTAEPIQFNVLSEKETALKLHRPSQAVGGIS